MLGKALTDDERAEMWSGDQLERQACGIDVITYLLGRYERRQNHRDSLVLNINGSWGAGKSFMLEKLTEELRAREFPVVFFDAWANDYSDQPLMAFASALHSDLQKYASDSQRVKKAISQVGGKAMVIAKNLGQKVIDSKLKKWVGTDTNEIGEILTKGEVPQEVIDIAAEFLAHDQSRKTLINLFHSDMEGLVNTLASEKKNLPIFVVIDELDRCRPNFAVEFLEAIKHLLQVAGVYFIVATDTEQLAESIKAVYGANFDGRGYLKRFFEMEYRLPAPKYLPFAQHLFSEFSFSNEARLFTPLTFETSKQPSASTTDENASTFALFSEAFGLKLRDQIQVCQMLEAALIALPAGRPLHLIPFFVWSMLKLQLPAVFEEVAGTRNLVKKGLRESGKIFHNLNEFTWSDVLRAEGKKKVPLIQYIAFYESLRNKTITEQLDLCQNNGSWHIGTLRRILLNETPREYVRDFKVDPHELSRYDEMVAQAGRLILQDQILA